MDRREWLAQRKLGIGSSDVAAVLGACKYRTPYQVWLDKTSDEVEEIENDAMYWGKKLEPVIADAYAEKTGKSVICDVPIRQHAQFPVLQASLDRLVVQADGSHTILECKTASSYVAKNWEHGVPLQYYLQVQHQMAVSGLASAEVALLVDGREFSIFSVQRDNALIEKMESQLTAWWNTHVVARIPPQLRAPDLERVESTQLAVEASDDVWQGYTRLRQLNEAINDLTAKADAEKIKLQEALGECALLERDGQTLATWKNSASSRFDSKKFQSEHPDLYEKYLIKSTSRRFLLK